MRRAEISIIIPFHGHLSDLLRCLNGLRKQIFNFTFEIIIVASRIDNEINKSNKLEPHITLVSFDDKLPPGKARNIGAKIARSDLLAFIDSDCVPELVWLAAAYSSLKNGNEIVIGPIADLFPLHPIASIDNLLLFPDFQKHRPSWKVAHFPGCNFGISKKLFTQIGGFPEDMQIGEDTKFSRYAIKKCHGKLKYNNRMVVRHMGRMNFSEFIKHHEKFGYHRIYDHSKSCIFMYRFRKSYLYAALFGTRRMLYILVRTLQLNPCGMIKIIIYFPILLLGLSAWVKGFWKQNQTHSKDRN
jgi:glycosyltransferase involved in cell wall biosynthesis